MKKTSKIILAIVSAVAIFLLGWFMFNSVTTRAEEVSASNFIKIVEQSYDGATAEDWQYKDVKFVKIVIKNYTVYGYKQKVSNGTPVTDKNGLPTPEKNYSFSTSFINLYTSEAFTGIVKDWSDNGLDINFTDPNAGSALSSVLSTAGLILVLGLLYFLLTRSAMGNSSAKNFGKTKTKVTTNIRVRFDDVAGAEEEKLELQEITEFLRSPEKFTSLGARIPKGVLLVGPPGTGKTLFAKAVAGEAGVPFFSVSGSDFVEMYVGVGASRVRDLFDIAKRNAPCIIFIDEIDAVGRERGAGLGGGNDEREQTLNQILVQMDGFEANEAIIIMAATNRADVLDPALLRPGRFDRKITVNLPDVKGREAILKVHARNKPLAGDVNFKTLARITAGFSGADLENLLNEAAILAARADKKFIGNAELYEGVNKVEMGPQKKSHVVTEADKRITAYHEAGHAILSEVTKHGDTVHEVTIVPRGMAAGYTFTRPDNDDAHYSKNKLLDMICMMLGGRVAEELVIQDVSTGASNDLQRASNLARRMVSEWGMSDRVGLVSYGEGQPVFIGKSFGSAKEYGDMTASVIDEEVRKILEGEHERAKELLTKYRTALDNMARVLVERETIYTEEVEMLIAGKSVAEVEAFMDEQDKKSNSNPFERFERSMDKTDNASEENNGATNGDTPEKSDETAAPTEKSVEETVTDEAPKPDSEETKEE